MYKSMKREMFSKKKWVVLVSFLLIVIVIWGSVSGFARARKAEKSSYKYYTSIAVGKGDTLWSIASENMTSEYDRIEEYIQEIRRLNHLYDDGICAGEYLTIPRYFEETLDHSSPNEL